MKFKSIKIGLEENGKKDVWGQANEITGKNYIL